MGESGREVCWRPAFGRSLAFHGTAMRPPTAILDSDELPRPLGGGGTNKGDSDVVFRRRFADVD